MENQTYRNILDIESKPGVLPITNDALVVMLEAMSDIAELIGYCKKVLFTGKPIDRDKIHSLRYNALASLGHFATQLESQGADKLGNPVFRESGDTPLERVNKRLLHAVMGKFDESGELAAALLKQIGSGELDVLNFKEELGDDRFYTEVALDELGTTMDDIQALNFAKLKDPQRGRYRNGFSAAASENRDTVAERALMTEKAST